MGVIRSGFRFLVQSRLPRDSSMVMTGISMISKVLGYGRVVLIAALFGASAGMDAYYVAIGSLGLLVSVIPNALESAVLPLLAAAESEGQDCDLMASVFWAALLLVGLLLGAVALAPTAYVRLFALHFDPDRLHMAGVMTLLLVPWGVATVLRGLLTTWATHVGKYTLPTVTLLPLNFLLFFLIIPLGFMWNIYGMATAWSIAFCICVAWLWSLLKDFPLRWATLPWKALRRAGVDCLLCVGLTGAGALYHITDRFFASGLPVGSIAALSYAGCLFAFPQELASSPLLIYLSTSSKAAVRREDVRSRLKGALSIAWAYFMPCGAALVAVSRPLVSLVFNYGAFDASATDLTSLCLMASAAALPLALWQTVLYRYIQSVGQLRLAVWWSYFSVLANALLDWFLAPRLGAPGLCLATSIVWGMATIFYMSRLTPGMLREIIGTSSAQVAIALVWGSCIKFLIPGDLWPLVAVTFAMGVHVALCQKLGLYSQLPSGWRPSALLGVVVGRFRRS